MGLFSQDDNAEIWRQEQIKKEIQEQVELDLAIDIAERCRKYSKQNCKGCPDAQYCPNYISYEDWLINNYAEIFSNDTLDQVEKD